MKKIGIYRVTLRRPDGSVAHYVGQSTDLKQRLRAHKHNLRHGVHANAHLQAAWGKYGEAAFEFYILEEVLLPELLDAEERWIDSLGAKWARGGFNQRIVANSSFGVKKPAEAVARSAAGNRGKKISAEHKAAISRANKGRRPTDECIRRAIEARNGTSHMLGKTHSLATRWKISTTKQARRPFVKPLCWARKMFAQKTPPLSSVLILWAVSA